MGFPRRRCCAPFPGYGFCSPGKRSATGKMAVRLTAKHKNKRPGLPAEPFVYVAMTAAFPGGGASHLFRATGSVAPVSAAPPGSRRSAWPQNTKTKGPVFRLGLSLYLMPGSSLLSHGETPHYHRRYGVSLLSSAWGQVGPPRYRRQANSVFNTSSGRIE